jgi:hypothetical protein
MENVSVEIPFPLSECITFCEVECVIACCGIDAVSTDPVHIEEWCRLAGSIAVIEARLQLAELIAVVEDRSYHVTSALLNLSTFDYASRRQLLDFLGAFDAGLEAGDPT